MSDRYKNTFRGYLIDHHSPDPPVVTLDKLDVAEYERFFVEAGINNLMLYCKDHWGVTYYNTKVGKKHPGLKNRDWVAELRPVLNKLGIEFNAYYCLEYETHAPLAHPEWSILKPDGTPLKLTGRMAKWTMPCYETGYRGYVLAQLSEIVSGYHPDSLFLDIFGKSLCYCPTCKAKFSARFGYALPETEAALKDANKDVTDFLDDSAQGMLQDIRSTLKSLDPGLAITINFAALYKKSIRDLLDYQFTEPWAGNWLSAAYARDTAKGQFPQLGPGDVSEVYNYRHKNLYILAAAQIAAQGCRVFLYSGSQHPDGTLEHEEARRIGAAYREVAKYEAHLTDRQVIADVGIVQSDTAGRVKADGSIVVNAIGRVKKGDSHREALLGAMKLCDASQLPWCVVPEQELSLERARQFQSLLLPNVYHVSPALAGVLRQYVAEGGTLISAGETGLYGSEGQVLPNYTLADLYGCDFTGLEKRYSGAEWSAYLKLADDEVWKHTPDTTPPVRGDRHLVKPAGAGAASVRTLAWFVDPAVELTDTTWVNWWCPPPSYVTGQSAVLSHEVGKGRVLFAAFDLFTMETKGFHLLKGLFLGLLESLVPHPTLRLVTATPHLLGYVAYDRPGHKELVVHQVSHLAELADGDAPALDGGGLVLDAGLKLVSAELVYPQRRKLELTNTGSGWKLELPPVSLHQIVRIDYA